MVEVIETRMIEGVISGIEFQREVVAEYDSWDEARKVAARSNEDPEWTGSYTIIALRNIKTNEFIDDYGF